MREARNLNKPFCEYERADVSAMLRKGDETQILQYAVAAYYTERFVTRGGKPDYLRELAEGGKRYSWKRYHAVRQRCSYINAVNVAFRTNNTQAVRLKLQLILNNIYLIQAQLETCVRTYRLQELTERMTPDLRQAFEEFAGQTWGRRTSDNNYPYAIDGAKILEAYTAAEDAVTKSVAGVNAYFAAFVLSATHFNVWDYVDKNLKLTIYAIAADLKKSIQALKATAEEVVKYGDYFPVDVHRKFRRKKEECDTYAKLPLAENDFKYFVDAVIKAGDLPDAVARRYRRSVTAEEGNGFMEICYNTADDFFTELDKQANAIHPK